MKIGYARTSTLQQEAGFASQLRTLLQHVGCEEVFQEQVSSMQDRAQLDAAIRMLRAGDVLVVTKLDRFARSLEHAIRMEAAITKKGASLQILDPSIDTGSPMGRMMFGVIGAVAQFEREIMLERQRTGIEAARAAGKYRGRKPTARLQKAEILRLAAAGVAKSNIARQLGIGERSVFRILAAEAGA
jgi:DNA invertase Pin-like site-specific DNA recombinase